MIAILLLHANVHAAVQVVTTLPEIAWAAREIGGERVEARPLLKGTEDPHFVDAVPEFIRLASNAGVVCLVGMDLEMGWLPKVLQRSGNAAVQPGGLGYCELGKSVTPLEKPAGAVDRSAGDVHPQGNPHFTLGPAAFSEGVGEIAAALARVDSEHAADYVKGLKRLRDKLAAIHAENRKSLAGAPLIIEYHREFLYFARDYGIRSFGSIEEKPGVSPSAGRLAEVAAAAKAAGVKLALAADFHPRKTMERFSELSGIPFVTVPVAVQPAKTARDYEALQKEIVGAIVKGGS